MWLCAYSQVCQFLKRGANQQALDNKGRVSGSMLKKKFILQIDVNGQEDKEILKENKGDNFV